jgi:ribosomal protein L11
MAAKELITQVKLQVPAGAANPGSSCRPGIRSAWT